VTAEEVFDWAVSTIHLGEGTATRSRHHGDPPLHILSNDGCGPVTWCGGGKAHAENTPTRRRCPRCVRLARDMWDDLEQEALDGAGSQ